MSTPQITIEKLKTLNGAGSIKAVVELRIGETLFRGFKVVQQPGQEAWVAPPSESWTGTDGKKRFTKLVQFPPWLQEAVEGAVLAAYELETGATREGSQ